VFEFRRQRRSLRESFSPAGNSPAGKFLADRFLAGNGSTVEVASSSTALFSRWSAGATTRRIVRPDHVRPDHVRADHVRADHERLDHARPEHGRRDQDATSNPRELPDVTGFLVVVLVTLGLFVVPVGATIMQGPAIVASILGR
jgi:hypothetical protein